MQVNISATLPNAAAEPAASETDHVQDGSASSFFAQMAQIWNAKTDQDVSVGKPDDKASTKAEGSPLTLLMLASLVPGNIKAPAASPISSGSVENKSSESASDPQVSAPGPACGQTLIPISIKTGDGQIPSHALTFIGNKRLKNTDSSNQPQKTEPAVAATSQSGNASPDAVVAAVNQPMNSLSNEAVAGIPAGFYVNPGSNPDVQLSVNANDEQVLSQALVFSGNKLMKNAAFSNQPEKTNTAFVTVSQSGNSLQDAGIAATNQPENSSSSDAVAGIPAGFYFNSELNPDVQPVSKGQDSISRSEMDGNKLEADSPALPKERMPAGMPDGTEAADKRAVDSARNIGESVFENLENPTKENLETEPVSGQQVRNNLPNSDLKVQSSLGKSEISAGAKNSSPASMTVGREVLQATAATGRQEAIFELHQGISPGSGYGPSSEGLGPNISLPVSDKSSARQDALQIMIPEKIESIGQAAIENAGAGNDPAGQESQRNDPGSWTIPQTRQDNSRIDFSKSWTQLAERQQDIPSQPVSGAAHFSDSGSAEISARSEVAPSQPKEFISQLAEKMQVQLQDGKEEIRIQLKPDTLGHIEIRAESTTNGVVARIVAETGNVKNYLESNLHLLHQSLQDQGLKIDRIQVTIQNSSQSFSGHYAQSGNTESGYQGRGTGRSSDISANQPEELSVDAATWIALNPNSRFHTVA